MGRAWGGGFGEEGLGRRVWGRGWSLGKFNIDVPFLFTLRSVPLLLVPFLPKILILITRSVFSSSSALGDRRSYVNYEYFTWRYFTMHNVNQNRTQCLLMRKGEWVTRCKNGTSKNGSGENGTGKMTKVAK